MAARSIRWRAACCRSRSARRPSSPGGCSTPTRSMISPSRFGAETDTLDAEGEVVARSDVRPTLAEIEAVLPRFTGQIEQVPPAYSALKVDGKRAYDLARAGEEVELKTAAGDGPRRSHRHPRDRRGPETAAVPDPACGMTWMRSPSPPTSPRAPISARSRATSPRPWKRVGHVTMLRRHQGRSVHARRGDFAGQIGRSR